jgi:hypothetical protein
MVVATGSQLNMADRMRDTFDTMTATFTYGDYQIQWEHNAGKEVGPYDRNYGVAFIGENGTLVADRSKWQVIPEWKDGNKETTKTEKVGPIPGANGHTRHPANFIACVKSREEPVCPVEIGRAVAVNAHMANIAVRSGSYHLKWDEGNNRFVNEKTASKLIKPNYRKPWSLPNIF